MAIHNSQTLMDAIESYIDELYEASMKGCTLTLDRLIHAEKLIIHKVSLNSFSITPLHIASLLGHYDFTIALLQNNPQLATELGLLGQLPLLLASATGHAEIVETLLQVDTDVCMVRDHEDRIPVHLAVLKRLPTRISLKSLLCFSIQIPPRPIPSYGHP